jgi:hypothetical protein
MKNFTKLFAIAIVILGFSATSFAQSSISASSTATLVVPLSITKTTDMDFGVVASSAAAGTIVMSTAGAVSSTLGASVISGTTTTAVFHVTGAGTESISVGYPTSLALAGVPSGSLTLSSILADCGTSTNLVGGAKDIKFSAVLEIPANTVAGVYSNATGLLVTVNYN